MAVRMEGDAEVDFDDPTYMRIADVLPPPPEQIAMKKSGTIYSDLDDLCLPGDQSGAIIHPAASSPGGAGEVIASGLASADVKGATKQEGQEELISCGQIDLGVDTDSDSEADTAVTGPKVIRQETSMAAVLSGEDPDASIPVSPQRRVVSMALSEDLYRSASFFFDDLSPDFTVVPYQPAMFGKDGFAPVSCGDNPFNPCSNVLLKARDRNELEESLKDFADSLVRSERPPVYSVRSSGMCGWVSVCACTCVCACVPLHAYVRVSQILYVMIHNHPILQL